MFEPDQHPSIDRCTIVPSIRRTPDGTLLDLTRPFTDRHGETWHAVGYTLAGHPLISQSATGDFDAPIGVIWDECGPLVQSAPSVDEWEAVTQ